MTGGAPDRDLVRLHWSVALRPAFDALLAIDDALANVALSARDPHLAVIKLAWWREQLEALDSSPAPAEPRLRAAAAELLPRRISGTELAQLEDGWLALLQPAPDRAAVAERGALLFRLAARLLGGAALPGEVGRRWALADVARRTGETEWLDPAPPRSSVPRRLRPLGALASLAFRDHRRGFPLEAEGAPARAWTLIRHRLTGRL